MPLGHGNLGQGVVLLHGISRTSRSLRKMQSALNTAGFSTLNVDYPSRSKPLEQLVDDVHPAIDRFARSVDGDIHFVAHSMGGLLVRMYLAKYSVRVGRIVMLGTPNSGSEIADRLKDVGFYRFWFGPAGQQLVTRRADAVSALLPPVTYPVGIVAGNRSIDPVFSRFLPKPHDGKVSVENTKLEGMSDHIVLDVDHTMMIRNARVIAQTLAFLRDGRFSG